MSQLDLLFLKASQTFQECFSKQMCLKYYYAMASYIAPQMHFNRILASIISHSPIKLHEDDYGPVISWLSGTF